VTLPVVFPRSLNWFFSAQAQSIADDMSASGVLARAVASDQPWRLAEFDRDVVLVVSFAESLIAAERQGRDKGFLEVLDSFERRILVNFDSVRSTWFTRHFDNRRAYFSDILDIGLYRQTLEPAIMDTPYHFVPESLARSDRDTMIDWAPGRAVPWTMLGHSTRDRSALVEAALRCLPKNGFVFSPPLRPFTDRSGLNRAAIARILSQTDLYIWGSHHLYPYHETQRVLHAITAGAVPVKIDPLHSHRMTLPWVYPSLEALLKARDREGLDGLYASARATIEQQGGLGDNVCDVLARIGAVSGTPANAA
jgi:hypothetical protein